MIKMSAGRKTFIVFNTALLCLLSFLFIAPYLHIFAKALNEASDTALGKVGLWPNKWTFDNMMVILIDETTWYGFAVTVSRVVIGSALALIVTYFAAYALLRKNLRFRKFIVAFLTVPMFFGGGLIATYVTYANLHILNTFWVYILPCAFNFFNMVVVRTYLQTIPDSLCESARIDGGTELQIVWRIMLPLSMPIVATIILWNAVFYWNDWTTTLYYITNPNLYTLQYNRTNTQGIGALGQPHSAGAAERQAVREYHFGYDARSDTGRADHYFHTAHYRGVSLPAEIFRAGRDAR